MSDKKVSLTLKWGTLKTWDFGTDESFDLFKKYVDLGTSASAMTTDDTPEQKEIICKLIDLCDGETIHLEWDGVDVSKAEAKKYVLDYGKKEQSK
jgi:hypothetical protein